MAGDPSAIGARLGGEFEDGVGRLFTSGVGDEGESGLGEDVEAEVLPGTVLG